MKQATTFEDVLIVPTFSDIVSRSEVNPSINIFGKTLRIPIISSPMDTVTNSTMCNALNAYGTLGTLHRFMSIEQNIQEFIKSNFNAIVSIGINDSEFNRAITLFEVGATIFNIDVAHGAMSSVVDFYRRLRLTLGNSVYIIVGNFATRSSVDQFLSKLNGVKIPDALRVGVGGGSACSTRIATGCGYPTLASLIECKDIGIPLICDGGVENSGDVAKALAAGATLVMTGYLFAATDEAPGESYYGLNNPFNTGTLYTKDEYIKYYCAGDSNIFVNDLLNNKVVLLGKKYRGSASYESYEAQGKVSNHRAPEGISTVIDYKGPITNVLTSIEGGLRSAMTYVGSKTINEFKQNAKLVEVSYAGFQESKPYAKAS